MKNLNMYLQKLMLKRLSIVLGGKTPTRIIAIEL